MRPVLRYAIIRTFRIRPHLWPPLVHRRLPRLITPARPERAIRPLRRRPRGQYPGKRPCSTRIRNRPRLQRHNNNNNNNIIINRRRPNPRTPALITATVNRRLGPKASINNNNNSITTWVPINSTETIPESAFRSRRSGLFPKSNSFTRARPGVRWGEHPEDRRRGLRPEVGASRWNPRRRLRPRRPLHNRRRRPIDKITFRSRSNQCNKSK